MKEEKRRLFMLSLLSCLWIAFIFWHSTRTAVQSSAESGRILEFVRKILPFMTHTLLRKLGHMTEFTVLGALLALTARAAARYGQAARYAQAGDDTAGQARGIAGRLAAMTAGRRCWGVPFFIGLMTAVCDETIQLFVPGRSAEVRDVLIDAAGVLLGAALVRILIRRRDGQGQGAASASGRPADRKEKDYA